MSTTTENVQLWLGNFLRDGDESSWIKKLKKAGLIAYTPGKPHYALTTAGIDACHKFGLTPHGMTLGPDGRLVRGTSELAVGLDLASPEGDKAGLVVLEKRGGKLRVLAAGTYDPKSLGDAASILEPAGKGHLLEGVSLSGDDIDDVDEATGKTVKSPDAYMLWIGAEHYPTIEDFVNEAAELGVSKRMSNAAVCKKVVESGLPVLLAHDEGKRRNCPACEGELECPVCRKVIAQINRLRKEARELLGDTKREDMKPGLRRQVELREAKANDLADTCCPKCNDAGSIKEGTGGHVVLKDGAKLDYRQYNYWLHQPKKIGEFFGGAAPESVKTLDQFVAEDHMCETCGGRGELPEGAVFGLFFPTGMEYIAATLDSAAREARKAEGFDIITGAKLSAEKKRGCGRRKPGGVYVTAGHIDGVAKHSKVESTIIEALKAAGAELRGPLIRFLKPVGVDYKRCRGVKSVRTDGELRRELEMIQEALE